MGGKAGSIGGKAGSIGLTIRLIIREIRVIRGTSTARKRQPHPVGQHSSCTNRVPESALLLFVLCSLHLVL